MAEWKRPSCFPLRRPRRLGPHSNSDESDNVTGSGWNHDRIYYYYARWNGSAWENGSLPTAAGRFVPLWRRLRRGMTVDPENRMGFIYYISSNAANPFHLGIITPVPLRSAERYEIWRGVTADGGLNFRREQITVNSAADNLRRIVPVKHGYDHAVLWFDGVYTSYTNYSTRMLGIFWNDLKVQSSSLSPATNSGTITWSPSETGFDRGVLGNPHSAHHAGTATADLFFDFLAGGHGRVTRSGGGESAVGGSVLDGFLGIVEFQETKLQTGGKTIPTAHAVEDLKTGILAGFVEFSVVPEDG